MHVDKKVVLFMGPPGSGKGTLSEYCQKNLGWLHISTGELLREHIKLKTKIGQQIDFIIKSGKLVSDDMINKIVQISLKDLTQKDCSSTVILDGYPRTKGQAKALKDFLLQAMSDVSLQVVRLNVESKIAKKRISMRRVCGNKQCQAIYSLPLGVKADGMQCYKCHFYLEKRSDDEAAAVEKRFDLHSQHEEDLVSFYDKNDVVVLNCDAEKPAEEVFEELKFLMGSH